MVSYACIYGTYLKRLLHYGIGLDCLRHTLGTARYLLHIFIDIVHCKVNLHPYRDRYAAALLGLALMAAVPFHSCKGDGADKAIVAEVDERPNVEIRKVHRPTPFIGDRSMVFSTILSYWRRAASSSVFIWSTACFVPPPMLNSSSARLL